MYIFESTMFWFEIVCRLLCCSHDTIIFSSIAINVAWVAQLTKGLLSQQVPRLLKNSITLRANNCNKIIFMKTHLEI